MYGKKRGKEEDWIWHEFGQRRRSHVLKKWLHVLRQPPFPSRDNFAPNINCARACVQLRLRVVSDELRESFAFLRLDHKSNVTRHCFKVLKEFLRKFRPKKSETLPILAVRCAWQAFLGCHVPMEGQTNGRMKISFHLDVFHSKIIKLFSRFLKKTSFKKKEYSIKIKWELT